MNIEPAIIVISGPPCSGKSTLAAELSRRLGVAHLELDRLRSRLLPQSHHSEADRDLTYRAVHLIAEHVARENRSVIIDATYGRQSQRRELLKTLNLPGIRLRLIQCQISPEQAVERFRRRPSGHFAVDLSEERVHLLASEYSYGGDGAWILPAGGALGERVEAVMEQL